MRWVWRIAAGLAVLLILVVVGAAIAIDSAPVRAWLAATIEDSLSVPGETEVVIEGLGPGLPDRFVIDGITVADGNGIWLKASQVELSWNPWALLAGRLELGALSADTVEVLRQPTAASQPPATTGGFVLPQPPGIAIDIGGLDIAHIVIDEAVAGMAATYALTGSADLGSAGAGAIALDLRRLDGAEGTLSLRSDIDLASNRLSLHGDLSEGEGGLLVRLLGIDGYPALSVTMVADGTMAAWQGTLSVVLAETADADLAFSAETRGSAQDFSVTATVHPGGLLAAADAALLGDSLVLDLNGSLDGDVLTLTSSSLGAEPATLTLRGTIGLASGALDVELGARGAMTPALARLAAPWSFAGWTLDATVAGSFEAPQAHLALAVEEPKGEGMTATRATLDGDVTIAGPDGDIGLSGTLALTGPDLGDPTAAAQLGASPSLTFRGSVAQDGSRASFEEVRLALAEGGMSAAGSFDGATGDIVLESLHADLPLEPFGPLADLELAGRVRLDGKLAISGWGDSATGDLVVETEGLTTGNSALDAVLGDHPGLRTTLSGGAERVDLETVSLDLAVWNGQGSLVLDIGQDRLTGTLAGSFQTTTALAREIDPALSGTGTLSVTLDGPLESPGGSAVLTLTSGAYDGMALGGTRLTLDGLALDPALHAEVRLALPFDGATVAASTALAFDAGYDNMALSDLAITGHGIDAGGKLTMVVHGSLFDGRVAGRVPDLAVFGPLLGVDDLAGRGVFEATFAAASGNQQVHARLGLDAATVQGVAIGNMLAAIDIDDALGTPSFDLRSSMDAVDLVGFTAADRILFEARGPLSNLALKLSARRFGDSGWTFDSDGTFQQSADNLDLRLEHLDVVAGHHHVGATAPLHVMHGSQGLSTDALAFDIDGGTLNLQLSQSDQGLVGALTIAGVPVAIAGLADPSLDMEGQIDGKADIDLTQGSGRASLDVQAADVRLRGSAVQEKATLKASADWHDGKVTLSGDLTGLEGITLDLAATWPLVYDRATGGVSVPQDQSVSGSLRAEGEIARLWQQLPVGDQLLSGQVDVQLTISGKAADPDLQGQASLAGGRFENLEWGTVIDDITLSASGSPAGNLRLTADANDGGSGKISIEGTADIDASGTPVIDAKLTLQEARLVRRDDAKATVNGDATFKGTLLHGAIYGRFETVGVDINVAQSLPSSVTVLNAQDVFEIHSSAGSAAPETPFTATLDVELDLPGRVFVRGRGLESEWSGKVKVTGTTADPQVNADLKMVRGYLDVIGRRFTLESGTVSLDPADEGDPRFDIVASIDSGDVSGTLEVSGSLSQPQLGVTTVPPLPEDEALSRLMFGKGAGSLSGFEALQLADALTGITGNGGGAGVLDRARALLGVDVLEVGTDDQGNATIGAGRYVAQGVYVGVQQGVTAGSSGVVVEIDLTDSISLETEAGSDATARVGIDWNWDY